MFEDEEFDLDLDFSDKCVKSKKETEKENVNERIAQETNKVSKTLKQGSNGPQKEQVLSTQKSMFSMDDTSESDSEILDISLNLDGDDKAKKETQKPPIEKDKAKKETSKTLKANKSKIESSISSRPGATQGTRPGATQGPGATQSTQKSIFSLDESFGDDSEILDISLNFDKKDQEDKVSNGRKSTDSLSVNTNSVSANKTVEVASNMIMKENQQVNKIQSGLSRKDAMSSNQNDQSSLRAGSSREQKSKSYNSTGDQKTKPNESVETSYLRDGTSMWQQPKCRNSAGDSHLKTGPPRDQQLTGYSHLRAGPSRDQQSKPSDSGGDSHPRAGSSRDQQARHYDSAGDSHLRASSSRDQQARCYDLAGDSHPQAGSSRDQQARCYDSAGDSHLRAGSSRDQQARSYDLTGDFGKDKTFQGGVKRGIENERVRNPVVERQREKSPQNNGNAPKRRFPGPAGILPILKPGSLALVVDEDEDDENTEQALPDLQCSQEDADENTVWIKALDDLGMQWGDQDSLVSKYNVGLIKQNAKPGSSIRMPILVARIKNLDTSCLDPICRLRDPHGEVGGSIHRDVIDQYGPQIQVGSILVLRNVIVLMTTKTQYVNITANNLVSIYRPDHVAHIHTVNVKDMEEAAEQLQKVRQEQLKQIQDSSLASAQPGPTPQPPAFSVPGQHGPPFYAGGRMMPECPSPLRTPGPSPIRAPGPSPIRAPGPYERRQQLNAQNNGWQQNSPVSSHVRQQNSHTGYQQNISVPNNRFQGQSNYQGQRNLPNNNNGNERLNINTRTGPQLSKTPPNPPMQQNHNNSPSPVTGGLRSSSVACSVSSNDGFRLPLAPQQSTNKFVFRPKASGPSKPLASSRPLANATNIARTNQTQESCFDSSQVLQKITESFRTPQSQASSVPESQNLIASMMEGLDSDSFFGDF